MKEAEEAKEVEKKKAKEVSKQPTIKETLERGTKVDPKSEIQKKFDQKHCWRIQHNFFYRICKLAPTI